MKLSKINKTFLPQRDDIDQKWWLLDADGMVLGRLATEVANILRGKDKPIYTPFLDSGDFVVVINAKKIRLTGDKEQQKVYYRHSGYRGGLKEVTCERMLKSHPERVIMHAVRGMLPKNRLNRKILRKLRVFSGTEHKHQAQKPEILKIQ
jgi:large subunit ribosomal protein L13